MRITESRLRQLIREALLTEEIFGKMAFIYHGTRSPPEEFIPLLEKDEFTPGLGAGAMYGKGLYTVYDLGSTHTSYGMYGNYVYKIGVNLDGFISFDPDVTARVYGSSLSPVEQARTLNLPSRIVRRLEEITGGRSPKFSSELAMPSSEVLKGVVKGIIFTSAQDGKVVVIYDVSVVTPVSYKKANETSWTKIDPQRVRAMVGRLSDPLETEKYETNSMMELDRLLNMGVIEGDLWLSRYGGVTELPDGLHVRGSFYSGNELTSLPKDLRVDGDVFINQNSLITSIPEGLHVGGDLNVHRAVTGADGHFTVGGNLRAASLSEIPPGTTIGGSAYLSYSPIKKIPDNFTVGRDLNLKGALVISELPRGLTVGGSLHLGRTKVHQLPRDLEVGGKIYVDSKFDQSTIPQHLKNFGGVKKIWVEDDV